MFSHSIQMSSPKSFTSELSLESISLYHLHSHSLVTHTHQLHLLLGLTSITSRPPVIHLIVSQVILYIFLCKPLMSPQHKQSTAVKKLHKPTVVSNLISHHHTPKSSHIQPLIQS